MTASTDRSSKLALYVYLLVAAYGLVVALYQPVKVELGVSQLSTEHVNDLLVAQYGSKLHAVQWQTEPAVLGCNRLSFRATETILDRPNMVRRFLDSMTAAGGVQCGVGLRFQTETPTVLAWLPLIALGLFWLVAFGVPAVLNEATGRSVETLRPRVIKLASQSCLGFCLLVLGTLLGQLVWLLPSKAPGL